MNETKNIHRFFSNDGFIHNVDSLKADILAGDHESLEEKLAKLDHNEIEAINKTPACFEDYLFFPALNGYKGVIEVLNKYKINIDRAENYHQFGKMNTLHAAVNGCNASYINTEMIIYLLNKGADVNLKNGWLETPFTTFLSNAGKPESDKAEICLLMLKLGAQLDQEQYEQYLPIIKKCIDEELQFTNIGTLEEPIYRMMDENGLACQTVIEKLDSQVVSFIDSRKKT
jgi:hypothetical protein